MNDMTLDEYRREAAARLMGECNELRARALALKADTEKFSEDHADFQRRVRRLLGQEI